MFKQNSLFKAFLISTTCICLAACSISPKVQAVQIGDYDLTKEQIVAELKKLDTAEQQVNNNKGVNFTNVGAALFWLPGLAVTLLDAHEASNLIHQRRSHLTDIYNKKLQADKANKLAAVKAESKKS